MPTLPLSPNTKSSTPTNKDPWSKEDIAAVEKESDRILQEAIDGKRPLQRGKIIVIKK